MTHLRFFLFATFCTIFSISSLGAHDDNKCPPQLDIIKPKPIDHLQFAAVQRLVGNSLIYLVAGDGKTLFARPESIQDYKGERLKDLHLASGSVVLIQKDKDGETVEKMVLPRETLFKTALVSQVASDDLFYVVATGGESFAIDREKVKGFQGAPPFGSQVIVGTPVVIKLNPETKAVEAVARHRLTARMLNKLQEPGQ